jgi:hypothetical protein
MRLAALVAIAASVIAVPAVSAAPKVACLQVTDDTGDAHLGAPAVPSSPVNFDSLDVVSADIASGSKNVVVAIRLKSLAPEPATTGGSVYTFLWDSAGARHALSYRTFVDAPPSAVYLPDASTATTAVAVTAEADPGTATLVMTMPRKLDPGMKTKGTKLSGFLVQTYAAVNRAGGQAASSADVAETARSYVDGTPTCLKGT